MNREIKFRAWDNKNKKWLCGYEYPNLGGFSLLGETVLLGGWSRVLDRFLMGRDGYKPDDLIVMQYTGLHDKNGKEIYESDILRHQNKETIGKVVWQKTGFTVWENFNGNGIANSLDDVWEVIGNVYQNPELIHPQ